MFSVTDSGTWSVFYKWPFASGLSSTAPLQINYEGGSLQTTIDEQTATQEWVKLCEEPFVKDKQYEAHIYGMPDGPVVADAIMLARLIPVSRSQGERIGYLYLGFRNSPPGTMFGGWQMPDTITDLDSPASTPILVDIMSTSHPSLSAHDGDYGHVLMIDGSVTKVPARQMKARWTDAYSVVHVW